MYTRYGLSLFHVEHSYECAPTILSVCIIVKGLDGPCVLALSLHGDLI
ncbi:hypothetical protein Roomu2_00118 [Pseudomonas phage vB_PpuM-Roomu-2]|uniref:Uncharacterized protein n=1 Tax=Pseudomonas phage vB_PpuM-Roomu-2 TaxID=3132621 RepID=A0AAX4N059_9CAUD